MDSYDIKQINLFRNLILRDIEHCNKTISIWQAKEAEQTEMRQLCRHMIVAYEAKKEQCESILREYDELFCDYIEKEAEEELKTV